jgi:predicted dehydrogenase
MVSYSVRPSFHPANQRLKEIVSSGELGDLKRVQITMKMPYGLFSKNDIRYNYDLGGGAAMDMGCYTVSYSRWLSGSEPIVKSAQAETLPGKPDVDRAMVADLVFRSSKGEEIDAQIACDLARPWRFGILPHLPEFWAKVVCERGEVTLMTFPAPTITHSLTILEKEKPKRIEYCHRFPGSQPIGEEWWTT